MSLSDRLFENDEEIRKLERAHQAEPTQSNWNRLHLAKERAGQGQQHVKMPDFDEPLNSSNAPAALKNYEKLQKRNTILDKNKDKTHNVLNPKRLDVHGEDPLRTQRRQNLSNRFSRGSLTVRDRLGLVGGRIRQVSPEGLERQRNYLRQDVERRNSLKDQGKVIKDQLKNKPVAESDEEIRKLERTHSAEPTQSNWNKLYAARSRDGLVKQFPDRVKNKPTEHPFDKPLHPSQIKAARPDIRGTSPLRHDVPFVKRAQKLDDLITKENPELMAGVGVDVNKETPEQAIRRGRIANLAQRAFRQGRLLRYRDRKDKYNYDDELKHMKWNRNELKGKKEMLKDLKRQAK